ncbi:MAG: helix-turn-helix transcriptional regulator [Alphaproteobacteria bacterium]|nr:helix-turn-helix transcriptional regulator [Alphaproteobacteria bacterium]
MNDDFAQNLRSLVGYYKSVAEVCRRIGINRSQFNKYLSGTSRPSRHVLQKICDFFGVEEFEIYLPHAQFVPIIKVRSPGSDQAGGGRPYVRFVDELLRHSRPELSRYAGYYFEYYYSMAHPGLILRSLLHLSYDNGLASYERIEHLGRAERGERAVRCKYRGLAFYLSDRIFLVDYEALTGNEMTQTILFPSYKNRVTRLSGLKLGLSSGSHREPLCARTVLDALGARINLRMALRGCGLFEETASAIDDDIRDSIVNTVGPGAYHFLAAPQ